MNASQAEAYIKSKLDGTFTSLVIIGGEDAIPRSITRKVPKDFNPAYDKVIDEYDEARESGSRGGGRNANPLNGEEEEKMVTMRQLGAAWSTIAAALHRSHALLSARYAEIERERGLPPIKVKPVRKYILSESQRQTILQMRADGLGYDDIAAAVQLDRCVVREWYNSHSKAMRAKMRRAA